MHRLTALVLGRPKAAALVLLLITAALGAGLPAVRAEYGYRVLVGDDHPSIRSLDALIEQFEGGLPVRIAWLCSEASPCRHALDEVSLRMAHEVTRQLESSAGVLSTYGPANAPILSPTESGLEIRRLVEFGVLPLDVADQAARAQMDPLWRGQIVSADGKAATIVVQPVDTRSETDLAVASAIEAALKPYETQGFTFFIRGDAVELVENGTSLAKSTARLTPLTVLVIATVLFYSTRSWIVALTTLLSMGTAVVWTVGLMGWLGWPRDAIHEVLLPLILVVGSCDAMHFLSRYSEEMTTKNADRASRSRLIASAAEVGPACLMTTLTTAAAFLSFSTSPLDTFVRFGLTASFGVAACLIVTFSLLPLLITLFPGQAGSAARTTRAWQAGLDSLVSTTKRRSLSIVSATALLVVVFGIGWATRLKVDTNWNESLGEHSQIVKATRFLERHFGKSQSLEIVLTLPHGTSLEDPNVLKKIDELARAVSEIRGLGSTTSVLDLIRRLNRMLHDDQPAHEEIGATSRANGELLELLRLNDSALLGSWVSLDSSTVRLSVEALEEPYSTGASLLESVESVAKSVLSSDWTVSLSGEVAMNRDWIRDVQATQFASFPTAAVVVLTLIGAFLRSARLACFALVPTLVPVVVTLGAMGWLGMGLDVGRTMIAAVLLGIGVDDAIHFLSEYRQWRARGQDPGSSVVRSFRSVGRAVVTTSIALSLGFLTLMASAWQTISSFGFFVSLAIMGALASTLLVLPALIFAFSSEKRLG